MESKHVDVIPESYVVEGWMASSVVALGPNSTPKNRLVIQHQISIPSTKVLSNLNKRSRADILNVLLKIEPVIASRQ